KGVTLAGRRKHVPICLFCIIYHCCSPSLLPLWRTTPTCHQPASHSPASGHISFLCLLPCQRTRAAIVEWLGLHYQNDAVCLVWSKICPRSIPLVLKNKRTHLT
ncbi:hypothetical protein T310_8970, partial [Rasamsonia emersonii CBS 393.64]